MKPKIFNLKIVALGTLLAICLQSFAQQSTDLSDYSRQMRQLQQQMVQMQKQMDKLRKMQLKKGLGNTNQFLQPGPGLYLQQSGETTNLNSISGLNATISDSLIRKFTLSASAMSDSILKKYGNLSSNLSWAQVGPITLNTINGNSLNTYNNETALKKQVQDGDVKEKIKNFSKTYSIDGNDKVSISNSYGKITVNTWNRNEVKVDVQIRAYADGDSDAQKLLDDITIADSKDNSSVSFETKIKSTNSGNLSIMGSWFGSGRKHTRKMIIDYMVYMPAKNQLQITNRYGSTEIPNFLGKLTIDNAYGSLAAKTLGNTENAIKVRYGTANIEQIKGSSINVAYGSLNVGEADQLNAEVSYSPVKIGKITGAGNIDVRYGGGVNIGDLDKNLKSLNINSSYSSVRLGINDNVNADFDVTVSYGSFSYDDRPLSIVSKVPEDNRSGWSPTKSYKGKVGKGNNDKVININARYGSVKFD